MSSTKALKRILSADSSGGSKKNKRKKPKKTKRERPEDDQLQVKNDQWLKHYGEYGLFAPWPEVKKKKKKKKKSQPGFKEELLMTEAKKKKLSKKSGQPENTRGGVQSGGAQRNETHSGGSTKCVGTSTQKERVKLKRVTFTLSPTQAPPPSPQYGSFFKPQPPCMVTAPLPPFHKAADGKPGVEETGLESQSMSDDINSQDLFITQRSSSDRIEICSSASPDEPPAPPPRSISEPPHCAAFEASTQTENFFTSPMPTSSFRLRHRFACTEPPLDLSLPNRTRSHRPAPKRAETMSSDDSDTPPKSKWDLTQSKAVQMRLNESFFFKLKGDLDSPKPRSPLMKIATKGK